MTDCITKKNGCDINIVIHTPAELKTNWYVFYTAPRAEKIVQKELSLQGYEVFLPIIKTLRIWKNRQKKLIEQVLFPSYIFVNTQESNLFKIRQIKKVATLINCGGKPSIIEVKCIEGLMRMLNLEQDISIESNFSQGENVRVTSGPLVGYEGVLVTQKGKTRFGIQLKEICQTVFIDISVNNLERVN